MPKVTLLLGSNLGDRRAVMERAAEMIEARAGKIGPASSYRESEPWGFDSENLFLNRALTVETPLVPLELLDELQAIETELGRVRGGCGDTGEENAEGHAGPAQYRDRPVDIDIIFYDNMVCSGDRLTIPHPKVQFRAFALGLLAEIMPSYVHPALGMTVEELADNTGAAF